MRRITKALLGVAIVVAVAFFFFAPVVYSPTEVYVGVSLQPSAIYPNWHSLSCWAFGIGTYYGSWYENGSYQFGCQPPPFWSSL
jgi:hypothetical protein